MEFARKDIDLRPMRLFETRDHKGRVYAGGIATHWRNIRVA